MNRDLEAWLAQLEGEGWTLIEARESEADLARPASVPGTITGLHVSVTDDGELVEEREDVPVSDYDSAIARNDRDAEAYYSRGVYFDVLGDRRSAIADYDKVIEIDPLSEDAFYRRGVARAEIGEVRGALDDLERALSLTKDSEDREEIGELIEDLRNASLGQTYSGAYGDGGLGASPSILPVPRQSVWPMVLLAFVTLGIYGPYWHFTRRKSLDELSSDQSLPEGAVVGVLLAAIVSAALTIITFGPVDASTVASLESIFGLLDVAIGAAYLFFAFRVRGILRDHLATVGVSDAGISWFWTLIFNFLYLQYKINQIRAGVPAVYEEGHESPPSGSGRWLTVI